MTEEERKELKIYYFQRRIIASQIYGDDFVEKVEKAFADVPYPNLEYFAGSPEHNQTCDECREANDFFVGKKWENCLDDEESFRQLGNGFPFFKPSVWHYFLPAYLIKLVKQARFSGSEFQPFYNKKTLELEEWDKEQIDLLSPEQCKVIVDYLEIALKVWEGIERPYQDDAATLGFWKENYRKALAKEQKTKK